MDQRTVFTKTAKGITQVNQRSASLSKDLMKVLKLIDGKSNFGQLVERADVDKLVLEKALNTLVKDGFARIFETRKEEPDPFAGAEDDFDFTAPNKLPGSTQRVVAGAANDISELVRQQEKAEADRKAKEAAHEAARAKARAEAEARAKLEAEAKARQQAELAAMEQARRAKEAAERARAELEAKMRAEEQRKRELAEQAARAAAEQKAKEEGEQRRLAELRAKAEQEANDRAREEAKARIREEEARQKAVAEQAARAAAEQKVKEEDEGRKLAELRAKAEAEAKALGEARARAEAEAAAMARARAEAEAAVQRQAQEASNAEAAMKARLKEEIESRIRAEMEALLRNEIEEKARADMQAQIMAEAKLAAKAELEERLREEREAIAKAEAEARVRAEQDAKRRADEESRKRAEAEARARAESEARMKAEEEARRLKAEAETITARARDAEARAKIESEARAREQAEVGARIEAERRAKIEAQARAEVEAEQREKQARELAARIDAERKGREEAEMRARIEAKARETIAEDTRAKVQAEIEGDMTKRAEIEGKAQAKAYMAAKQKAEEDEDQRLREEQARKAREIAQVLRTKVEPDEDFTPEAPTGQRRRPRKRNLAKPILIGIVAVLAIAIGLLHVVPLRKYTDKVEQALSAWLHDDVAIASMTFRLVPTPHLRVENVQVGKLLDAKAASGRVNLDILGLFGEKLSIDSIELQDVTISADAVRRIPTWGKAEGKAPIGLTSVRLKGVKMDTKPAIDSFEATLRFGRDGAMQSARLAGAQWTLDLKPAEGQGLDFTFGMRNWQLPIGVPVPISEASLKGHWEGTQLVVPEFEADAMEGKVNGTLKVDWAQGFKLESELALARANAKELVGAFTKDISVTGKLDGNFTFASEGASIETIFKNPRSQGKFRLVEGSVSNVDLVAVMQSDAAGQRAGVTKFAELTGEMASADQRTSFRNVTLQGGVLRGNGGVDVGANSALAGRLNLEIRSQVAQDRGSFGVSGTVARPIVRRGG